MINTVILMGRLTADAELKTTQSGVSVTSFTIAVDRSYQKQGQDKQTDFINCVAWRNTAEFISKYFAKGQMIALQGELQQRTYEDKQGNKRTAYDVVVGQVSFCGSKNEGKEPDVSYHDADTSEHEEISQGDEDLPF